MSQLVSISQPASGREMIERAAALRRQFFPAKIVARLARPRIPWKIVYSTPVHIAAPRPDVVVVYDAPVEISLPNAIAVQREVDAINEDAGKRIRVLDILDATAAHFGIRKIDLLSARRTRSLSWSRMVVFYLAREMTLRSLPEIGRMVGNKDHSSVHHGIRRIASLIAEGNPIAADVDAIRARLLA